ncbi:26S proteasome non-ATPase regulatory subunit 8 [Neolecta irregularis DAH-3]|uniref:26S proteasome non-ATPase regulatory subunit 8 n=1 Tax=Neolecta irregularis (strain DAH-3) TaxID=1198029 RepID=A0A1U7LRM2_NEOID|nr:26S proteasome non-ATPase regulatory subunit 8 [Neolecta irregularis DAH-3]|eukprot:OLL25294.1 26S proteasome non-ATPase regulatory subunit 8 [Neolecta irregularis DAH-3]
MSQLETHLKLLRQCFQKPDYNSCLHTLQLIKLHLTLTNTLLPATSTSSQILIQVREFLEIGAYTSLRLNDLDAFTRYYSNLEEYYVIPDLPKSANEYPLRGLSLLRLLSENRIAEFHVALEKLVDVEQNQFVQYPVMLERWIMEGSYDKVWQEQQALPSKDYEVFLVVLLETIREEIASGLEVSYDRLTIAGISQLLFIQDQRETIEFIKIKGWTISPNGLVEFKKSTGEVEQVGNMEHMIQQTLGYARELEQIV